MVDEEEEEEKAKVKETRQQVAPGFKYHCIRVKSLDTLNAHTIVYGQGDTLAWLRLRIEEFFGVEPVNQRLTIYIRPLTGEDVGLKQLGLVDGCTVHVSDMQRRITSRPWRRRTC